jgi:hypothetical protein
VNPFAVQQTHTIPHHDEELEVEDELDHESAKILPLFSTNLVVSVGSTMSDGCSHAGSAIVDHALHAS